MDIDIGKDIDMDIDIDIDIGLRTTQKYKDVCPKSEGSKMQDARARAHSSR